MLLNPTKSALTTTAGDRTEAGVLQRMGRAVASGTLLGSAALVSYALTTRILTQAIISRDDQMLGGMWSAVATLFVFRDSYNESVAAALSRTAATSLSFVLCFGYLLIWPFHAWGLAVVIAMGSALLMVMGRPGDVITTSITSTVVLVVAEISPRHAWAQPILRLSDTLIGIAVGIGAVWIGRHLSPRAARHESASQRAISTENMKETV